MKLRYTENNDVYEVLEDMMSCDGQYVEVEYVEEPKTPEGKMAVLKANKDGYWWEYVDESKPEVATKDNLHDKLKQLEDEMTAAQLVAVEEYEKRMKVESELINIQQAITEIYELMIDNNK